jgi:hypothetical protein
MKTSSVFGRAPESVVGSVVPSKRDAPVASSV